MRKSMKKLGITSLLLLTVGIFSMTVMAWAGENNAKEESALENAKVSLTQAINNALAAVPGQAVSAELDDELKTAAYVVEVVSHGQTYEVTLDTQSGAVLKKQLDREDRDDQDRDGHDREDKDRS